MRKKERGGLLAKVLALALCPPLCAADGLDQAEAEAMARLPARPAVDHPPPSSSASAGAARALLTAGARALARTGVGGARGDLS